MEKFLTKSSSNPNLAGKRPRDEGIPAADQWRKPKKFAVSKESLIDSDKSAESSNRFSGLPVDDVTSETFKEATKKKTISQIPPILIELLGDWTHQNIKTVIEKYEKSFHLQYRGRNKVKVQCYSIKGHQQVKDGLLKENVAFHTFSRKDEKLPKVVIKGLPKFLQATIPSELASIGFAGATITELKTLYPAECPPILVQLPSGTDMGKFKQIKYLSSCVIDIQRYKSNNKIGTQCFRCQGFGHASRNCNRPARCVKCASEHPTWECPKKDREEPARCCNCQENHPANYAQCTERTKYLERIQTKRGILRKELTPRFETAPTIIPELTSNRPSWAQVTRAGNRRSQIYRHSDNQNQDVKLPERKSIKQQSAPSDPVSSNAERNLPETTSGEKTPIHDLATAEMLEILSTIKSIKQEFIKCNTFMDKVILILSHLGHYV